MFSRVFTLIALVTTHTGGANAEGPGAADMDPVTTSEMSIDDITVSDEMTEEPVIIDDEAVMQEADWLPVGQMVTDLGVLYKSMNENSSDEKQDDEDLDSENLRVCGKALNDIASLPVYLAKEMVSLYSQAMSDAPEHLEDEHLLEVLAVQDDEGDEYPGITDADLDVAVKELFDDETENKLRQEVVASLSGTNKDPLDSDLVMRVVAFARSLHALQNMRCRNVCTSSVCISGSGLCNVKTCLVKKCPIVCYDSNPRFPNLNLCKDRPHVEHGNRTYCCPYKFHPQLNITNGVVKCLC